MKRTKTSKAWMNEHVHDAYVQKAKATGYRSRAVFKLEEINTKYHLLKPGICVVDLGAAPGSWCQIVLEHLGTQGRLLAVDLLPLEPLVGMTFIQGDFTEPDCLLKIEQSLNGSLVDVVLSDMAPNMSGIELSDQARSIYLAELALDFCISHLRGGGNFVVKVFQGTGFMEYRQKLQQVFKTVTVFKPKASRDRSAEVYLLGFDRR